MDSLAISSKMTGLGDCSSVRLEHLVVVQDVGGSNPLSHPISSPAISTSVEVRADFSPIALGSCL